VCVYVQCYYRFDVTLTDGFGRFDVMIDMIEIEMYMRKLFFSSSIF